MNVQQWRKEQKLTLEELGLRFGISTGAAHTLCHGTPAITLEKALNIVLVTQGAVGLPDLINREDQANAPIYDLAQQYHLAREANL